MLIIYFHAFGYDINILTWPKSIKGQNNLMINNKLIRFKLNTKIVFVLNKS